MTQPNEPKTGIEYAGEDRAERREKAQKDKKKEKEESKIVPFTKMHIFLPTTYTKWA